MVFTLPWVTRGHFLTSASKFSIEPNGAIFDASAKNARASPNVKTLLEYKSKPIKLCATLAPAAGECFHSRELPLTCFFFRICGREHQTGHDEAGETLSRVRTGRTQNLARYHCACTTQFCAKRKILVVLIQKTNGVCAFNSRSSCKVFTHWVTRGRFVGLT